MVWIPDWTGIYSTVGLTSDLYAVSFILLLFMFKFRFRNPIVLLALLQMFLMWSFHFRSALIVHPRYLADFTASSVCPCSWYSHTIGFLLRVIVSTLHLSGESKSFSKSLQGLFNPIVFFILKYMYAFLAFSISKDTELYIKVAITL